MNTETLIARLAENPSPLEKPAAIFVKFVGIGILAALALTWGGLGFRHDMAQAMGGWAYWAKFAYTLALALAGFVIVERLARPGTSAAKRWLLVLLNSLSSSMRMSCECRT